LTFCGQDIDPLHHTDIFVVESGRFADDSPLEGAGFEPSVPGRLQAKTPRFGIVLRRLLSSCGSFHIDHRLSCHVSPLIEFTV
jgi:hypothetical protein